MATVCARARPLLHVVAVAALAWWGHATWPQHLGGLLPLALGLMAWGVLAPACVALQGLAHGTTHSAARGACAAQRLARLGMLPMMAGLPVMMDLCSAASGMAAVLVSHAAMMLLPPLLITWLPARCRPAPGLACAALLAAAGPALLLWPGVQGLMAATLLQGAAWSLAGWATTEGAMPRQGVLRRLLPAAAVLVLGRALGEVGPAALYGLHAGLALCGVVLLGVMLLVAQTLPKAAAPVRTGVAAARL